MKGNKRLMGCEIKGDKRLRGGGQAFWHLWAVMQQTLSSGLLAQPRFRVKFLHGCSLFISNCSCSSQDNENAVVPTLGQGHQQGAKTFTGSSILAPVGSNAKTPGAEDCVNMRGQALERDNQSAGTSNLAPVGCHEAGLELRTRLG